MPSGQEMDRSYSTAAGTHTDHCEQENTLNIKSIEKLEIPIPTTNSKQLLYYNENIKKAPIL